MNAQALLIVNERGPCISIARATLSDAGLLCSNLGLFRKTQRFERLYWILGYRWLAMDAFELSPETERRLQSQHG
jgi:hypothetical protein